MKHVLCLSLFLIGTAVFLGSCFEKDPHCPRNAHNGITILNTSVRDIRYEIYWTYPDTIIGPYNPLGQGANALLTPGKSIERGAGPHSCWESVLKDGKKEWVYFFDNDSLQLIPWDTIRITGRGLLERKEIDLQYLEDHYFTVIYEE